MPTPLNPDIMRAMTRGRATGLRDNWGPDFVATHGSTMPPAGVETRARQMQPAPPVINTMASDRVAKLGMNGPAAPAMMQPAPAPMMRPAAPASPLGGMDPRPLSARSGGPMSYSPRGVGTNNPNSYAVGKNNKNFAERTGQMPMMQQAPPSMMMGASAPAAPALMAPAPAGMAPMPTGRDDAFWNQMSADTSGFMAGQDKLGADMQAADTQAAAKIEDRAQTTAMDIMGDMRKTERARETFPSIDPITGAVTDRYYTSGNGMMVPRNQPAPANMTPDDLAAAQAMGGSVTMNLPGGERVSFPGKGDAGNMPDFRTDKLTGRDYYMVPSETGGYKRQYVEDENGDGVVSPEEKKAAVTANGKTGLGHLYAFKK